MAFLALEPSKLAVFADSEPIAFVSHSRIVPGNGNSGRGTNAETLDPLLRVSAVVLIDSPIGQKAIADESRFSAQGDMHAKYSSLLAGYPMAAMAGSLEKQPIDVAAFLIGIAKKESDWGNHSPEKEGWECYNYWGFKGGYDPTGSGYSCFDTPEQAVSVVGERIGDLIKRGVDTPERMVTVWKCGSDCQGHDPSSVRKWIGDVRDYYAMAI